MRRGDFRVPCAAFLAAVALAACSEKSVRPESGTLDIVPKANKHYVVNGDVLTFVELEKRVAEQPPAAILLEQSRIRQGAACIMMLALKADIPVWMRTLNGQTNKLKADVKSTDVENIEKCR